MPEALTEAVRKLSRRSPARAALTSAEWAEIPLALRERAQFSATVESARVMEAIQQKLLRRIRGEREAVAGGTALVDRSSFIGDLRKIVAEEGLGFGTQALTDIGSRRRLGLIFDMQTRQAQSFAKWKMGQDPDVLDARPAQELIRVRASRIERDWQSRWDAAGGPRVDGRRMIALKTDPVWEAISAFGTPWPPFDFNSGMGLRNIRRKEAEALGLVATGQRLSSEESFNKSLEASARGLSPEKLAWIQQRLGDQVEISGDRIRWKAA